MKRDNPSSKAPDAPKVRIIKTAPPKAQQIPAWPVEEPDPQFDPGATRPVEKSAEASNKDNPIGIAVETVTPPVDDAAVSENMAVVTTCNAEEHQEKTQVGASATQDNDQEGSTTAMPHTDLVASSDTAPADETAADRDNTRKEYAADPEYLAPLTSHDEQSQQEEPQISAPPDTQDEAQEHTSAEKPIIDAEATPAPEGDNPDDTVEPDPKDEMVAESEVVKEAVNQVLPPKTALERGEEWKLLFRVLTEDGPPEIKERALVQFTTNLDEFKGAMTGKTPEQRAKIVSTTVGIINPLMMRADAYRCLCSIMIGELANHLKKDVPHGDWADEAKKVFPQIEPRDLQHSMRLAKVRKAACYCHLGKTKLIALAAIASKSPFNRADDPIGLVLSQAQGTPHILPEEYEQLAGAAIAEHTFKKKGLVVDLDVTRDIYTSGEEITDKDIAEMLAWQDRHEKGESELTPTDFLLTVLKNDGKRVFELTNPNEKKGMGKRKAQVKPKTPAIPDINSTFEKTRETVQLALDNLDPSNLKVDRELYHTLMTTLTTFGATVFPS